MGQSRIAEHRWTNIGQPTEFGTFYVVGAENVTDKLVISTRLVRATDKTLLVAEKIAMYMSSEFFTLGSAASGSAERVSVCRGRVSTLRRTRRCTCDRRNSR